MTNEERENATELFPAYDENVGGDVTGEGEKVTYTTELRGAETQIKTPPDSAIRPCLDLTPEMETEVNYGALGM